MRNNWGTTGGGRAGEERGGSGPPRPGVSRNALGHSAKKRRGPIPECIKGKIYSELQR